MLDSKIDLSTPSKMVRFGVSMHGSVRTYPASISGGRAQCSVSDYRITTRGGKTLPLPYSVIDSEKVDSIGVSPRPFLYEHPLASIETEDANGQDWSGYVVFYEPGTFSGYLNKYLCAYTPDDNSQGILFTEELKYISPLMIGGSASLTTRTLALPDAPYVPSPKLVYISKDGRYRVRASFSHFSGSDTTGNQPSRASLYAYSLSGTSEIVAASAPIAAPEYDFVKSSLKYIPTTAPGIRFKTASELIYDACVPVGEEYTNIIYIIPDGGTNQYTTVTEGSAIFAVDAYVTDTAVDYLYCESEDSMVADEYLTHEILYESIVYGEACTADFVPNGHRMYFEWEYATHETSTDSQIKEIRLSGFGGVSIIQAEYESETTSIRNASSYGGINTYGDWMDNSDWYAVGLSFDGVSVFSAQDQSAGERIAAGFTPFSTGNVLDSSLPLMITEGQKWSKQLYTRKTVSSTEIHLMVAEIALVKFAEGVQALAIFVTRGVANNFVSGKYGLDESTVTREFIIGKIFGFGQIKEGLTVAPELWDKQLHVSYDPLTKQLSDVLEYPVFYQ